MAWRRLCLAAWLALGLHLIAGLAMAITLRHGLETNADLIGRLRFIADHTAGWVGAWLTWNAAALSVLYYFACFASAHGTDDPTPGSPLRFAVTMGAAGVALDLAAEAVEMGVLPALARSALADLEAGVPSFAAAQPFLMMHRTAVMVTGYAANGLYSFSALLLTWFTRRSYPKWIWMAGLAVGSSGFALSWVSLINSTRGMLWANAVLLPSLLTWLAGVAITAAKRNRMS